MEAELIPGLGGGDRTEPQAPLKREHDSVDDFEHLIGHDTGARASVHAFLDSERGGVGVDDSPKRTAGDLQAEKFTDSDSDADPSGESPRHAPAPSAPVLPPPLVPEVKPPVAEVPSPTPLKEATPLAPAPVEPTPVPSPPVAPVPAPAKSSAPVVTAAPVKPSAPAPVKPSAPAPVKPSTPAPAPPVAKDKPAAHVIEAEVIFCQMGLDAWFDPQRLHPKVESLIYWRDPARSGAALGAGLALLVALACCSVVSVLAYLSLLLLTGTAAFRIYKNILQAVQKTNEGHPFKWLLEAEIALPAERAQSLAAAATAHANAAAHELRRLFLVEDLVDSLKFGVLLWCLTYLGAAFNGITLVILGYVALFTLPKAYEANKAQVDANLELARAKINEITNKVRAAVPLGKKAESEKDK